MYSLHRDKEVDIKGIVLEQGAVQDVRPGVKLIDQMNYLTGHRIPAEIGLHSPLNSANDQCLSQEAKYQKGVGMILGILEGADEKIDIVSVGSLRDTAAAFNRNPQLFRNKVGRVFVFAGEASKPDFVEHNVNLDPRAFVAIMRSGLDIYWIPCFDGGIWHNRGRASWWQVNDQRVLFENMSDGMKKYVAYSLTGSSVDSMEYIKAPLNEGDISSLYGVRRNLYCAAILLYLNDYLRDGDNLYSFKDVKIDVMADGNIAYNDQSNIKVKQFYIKNMLNYASEMTNKTKLLLQRV